MRQSADVTTAQLVKWLNEPNLTSIDYANLPLPVQMSALTPWDKDEAQVQTIDPQQRKPSDYLRHTQVPVPMPQEGEVLVAVMAAGINYNNVWSSTFQPASPFLYLRQFAALRERNRHHLQPFMILGSDACGIVLRVGAGVENCKPGDAVCIHPAVVCEHEPHCHADDLLSPDIRAWGFETNYGAFAELTLVRASQILPKPTHLSWEEAASLPLVNSTVYRMLVSNKGAQLRAGENILIWGGGGGLGMLACQYALLCGATPVAVVSNAARGEALKRIGVDYVIDRKAEGFELWKDDQPNEKGLLKMRCSVRQMLDDELIDVVFEHAGAHTFWASVALLRHGGRVVTCGSTSGYNHQYDNRRLWMQVKSIIGSHGANYHEAWQANRLVCRGRIQPVLTAAVPLEEGAHLIDRLHANTHTGKFGLLCLSDGPGQGITDWDRRQAYGTDEFLRAVRGET